MTYPTSISRRHFLHASAGLAAGSFLLPTPLWAASRNQGIQSTRTGPFEYADTFNLTIGPTPINVAGRTAMAQGINGTVPGPLLRFKEGNPVTLVVRNELREESSLHWHGLLLPPGMDGVPGISFDGIRPGQAFRYHYAVIQSGTYWYHSHSGLQEQSGVYGPIIIDPAGKDPVSYDREFVILLSDWTFEDPDKLYRKLKKMDAYYNYRQRTVGDFFDDVRDDGWNATVADRRMWGSMRMSATDIADVTGAGYQYLMNGMDPSGNWSAIFAPGEKIRLRIINGSAMTFFNFRIPGLPMTVVQADGQDVEPVETDEFQIGIAETYDVVVEPTADKAYTLFAESMDRSGFARGTLAPNAGMQAKVPALRDTPVLTMADMGMNHGGMDPGGMDHAAMGHGGMQDEKQAHNHKKGPGVANVAENTRSRLDDPGIGLESVKHRALTYRQLRSLEKNTDTRPPQRTLELHLTGNMERYMWSFDGVKYSEVESPIVFQHGERIRLVFVNDTMMSHPIHLHGMFVELDNGNGDYNPRKHTVVVKPAEKLAVNVTVDPPGDWAFHCHMLFHMKAGMMRSVSVRPGNGDIT